jgi:hypothetical protein
MITGKTYLDPGGVLFHGYRIIYDPPRRCLVLTQWGPGGGPRNVAVEYTDDGTRAVIPFARRLHLARGQS